MKKVNMFFISLLMVFFFNTIIVAQNVDFTKKNNFFVNAEMGATVRRINNINYFSTYTMPSFNFVVTPKLSVNTGLLFVNYQLDAPIFQKQDFSKTNHTYFKNYLYTQVNYQVNQKLVLRSSIMYEMNNLNFGANQQNKNILPKNYTIGAEYKINDYLHIGVQFKHQENTPFNMYNNSGFLN